MAVYRNDQVDFSFAAEAGLGGYLEPNVADDESSSPLSTTLDLVALPGARTIGVASTSNLAALDYIRIGAEGTDSVEVRQVASFNADDNATLTAPIGYYHAVGETVVEQDANSGILQNLNKDAHTSHHMRFTPGVWESIELPDPALELEGRYFLGTASKRNFYSAYKGQQSFSGTLSNFELLNGYPLRFPIGSVATTATDKGSGGGSTTAGITYKGQYELDVADATGYGADDYIQIGTGATSEVRKVTRVSSNNIHIDYPVMFEHAAGETCNEVIAPYTHTITETVELDGVSWTIKNTDSGETTANDWVRRYFGGKIGQSTLTAEEGGTLRMSWESAPFMDMQHNQKDSSAHSPLVSKFSDSIQPVTVEFPTTQPYYFSQGAIKLFGETFARITNFTINVNNNLEPRYFIRNDGSERTPSAIFEGRREYSMTATIVLPDSLAETATTRTLFKELLAEGDYGSGMIGFDIELVFTRTATTDLMTLTIPPSTAAVGGNAQGAFIRSSNTSVSTDNPVSTEVDILFRSMKAVIVDSEPVYP